MDRTQLKEHIARTYGVDREQPWEDMPDYWVFRRRDSKKWFALLASLPPRRLGLPGEGPVDILNLKLPPETVALLQGEEGCFPAYHMNKTHWITLLLAGPVSDGEIRNLIAISYDLAAKKRKKPPQTPDF